MHKIMIAVAAAVVAASTTGAAHAQAWVCSAPGLVSGSYDGGSSAYIHLTGFRNGNAYPVTKTGKVATGVTANGTKFTCRQK